MNLTLTNRGLDLDDRRLVGHGLGFIDGLFNGGNVVVTVGNRKRVPAIRFEALQDIFGKGDCGVTVNRDVVVVVKSDKLAELPVTFEKRERLCQFKHSKEK